DSRSTGSIPIAKPLETVLAKPLYPPLHRSRCLVEQRRNVPTASARADQPNGVRPVFVAGLARSVMPSTNGGTRGGCDTLFAHRSSRAGKHGQVSMLY